MVFAFTTNIAVAAFPPIVTDVAPVKFVPVMVTLVPPAADPLFGEIAVTVGVAAYVNSPIPVAVPPGVVTTTFAAPAVPAGVVAVIVFAFTTDTLVAACPPIVTDVAPVRFVPVMVTLVPPAVDPLVGDILLTVGVAT
jgi:hypothetical protein